MGLDEAREEYVKALVEKVRKTLADKIYRMPQAGIDEKEIQKLGTLFLEEEPLRQVIARRLKTIEAFLVRELETASAEKITAMLNED